MSAGTSDPGLEPDDDDRARRDAGPRASSLDAAPSVASGRRASSPPTVATQRRLGTERMRPLGKGAATSPLTPRMTAVFGGLFGLATVASVFALLIQVFPVRTQRGTTAASALPAFASEERAPEVTGSAETPRQGPVKRVRNEVPEPWRVDTMKATNLVLKGEMKRRSLSAALDEVHVPKDQVYRVLKAFDGVFKFDRPKKRDQFVVALERGSKKLVGFEYVVSPTEIYQAKSNDAGLLEAKRLDMVVKQEEFATAFYVGKNLTRSYEAAGLEPGLTKALNEAFNGQTSTEAFQEGGVVRAILVETTALGRFAAYERVKALEYRPPDPAKPALRAYWFEGDAVKGYVDDKGRHSSNAGWRSPVPGSPITSHFNPKRLHPVLHTVMPHNGTDFGAPTGTPVYAAFRGKVSHVGPQGPSGNLVLIEHPNGVQTGYAHLSRFADGIKIGDPVGTRQLIGYVGSTGRSTGPHLHFSAKRDGKFFNAIELKLDALQLLPAGERNAFNEQKARLDAALEAIPLPDPPEPSAAPSAEPSPSAAPATPEEADAPAADTPSADAPARAVEADGRREPGNAKPKAKEKGDAPEGGPLLGDDLSGDIE